MIYHFSHDYRASEKPFFEKNDVEKKKKCVYDTSYKKKY